MQWKGPFHPLNPGVFPPTLTDKSTREETCPHPTAVMTTISVVSCCMKSTLKVISWFCGWGIHAGISWVILLYHVALIESSHSVTVRDGWADLQGPRQHRSISAMWTGRAERLGLGWWGYLFLASQAWWPWDSQTSYGTAQDSISQCLAKWKLHRFLWINSANHIAPLSLYPIGSSGQKHAQIQGEGHWYCLSVGGMQTNFYPSMCALLMSHLQLFVTPWTVARQAPLSRGIFRWEYWSGLPFPPPGDRPDSEIVPASPLSPALQADSLPAEPLGKPNVYPRMFKSFHPPRGNSGLKKEERKNMKL